MMLRYAPLLLLLALLPQARGDRLPIFDGHVHYNLDIGRPLSVAEVLATWRAAGIRSVLLTSRPNDGTRELLAAAPPQFKAVAFARPYRVMADVQTCCDAHYRLREHVAVAEARDHRSGFFSRSRYRLCHWIGICRFELSARS